jgi:FkbM family methyltransferase
MMTDLGNTFKNSELRRNFLMSILQNEKINAVDIGGANGLQPHWMRMYNNMRALIFEPGLDSHKNLLKLFEGKIVSGDFNVLCAAISDTGGRRTLFLTNVPTGSSLLKPNESSVYVQGSAYFLPFMETSIDTVTLGQSLKENNFPQPDIIKLDVQGLEYQILKSLSAHIFDQALLYELEINLLDAYLGQESFQKYMDLFDEKGYQLLDLRTNRGSIPIDGNLSHYAQNLGKLPDFAPSIAKRLGEVDAIFIPKYEQIDKRFSAVQIKKLIALLAVFNFFNEALFLTKEGTDKGIFTHEEAQAMRLNLKGLHDVMRSELKPFESFLIKQNGFIWAQYMHVPYPSF